MQGEKSGRVRVGPSAVACVVVAVAALLPGCDVEEGAPTSVSGRAMGTTWSLQWRGKANAGEVHRMIQGVLDEREAEFSNWRADSAVSRFNASESLEWQAMPKSVVDAVVLAGRVAEETGDALDITVGPLVDLWGFGAGGPRTGMPSEEAVEAAKDRCGWQWLSVRQEPPAVRKRRPDVEIHLASVAEGLVMNEVVRRLGAAGVSDFLFELGGEVVARGEAAPGRAWRVGVQSPGGGTGEIVEAMELRDACLSTAGTYRQVRTLGEGGTVTHILDPRTGRPVTHRLASVSVLHTDCALADGYATALLVLGPESGKRTAERLGLRVVWIVAE